MTVTAHCHRCGWTAAGPWPDVDKAAEAHVRKTGHPTATIAKHLTATLTATRRVDLNGQQGPGAVKVAGQGVMSK